MHEVRYVVPDVGAADGGLARIDWALSEMPVLRGLQERIDRW